MNSNILNSLKTFCFLSFALAAIAASAESYTFDSNPVLGSNDPQGYALPGQWYVDRFAPAAFDSVSFQGTNRLHVGVSAGDYQASSFYNTQGRKLYLAAATVGSRVSAQLYIPAVWASQNVSPSMWLTLYDNVGEASDYPVIAFFSSGSGDSYFRVFDGNLAYPYWMNLSTPVAWDSWNTLSIDFTVGGIVYGINGTEVYTESYGIDNGSVSIANVMFQDKNFGTSYDAYWYDLIVTTPNISGSPVPEPATLGWLGIGGLLAVGFRKLRRN